jgi:hypothetical protein
MIFFVGIHQPSDAHRFAHCMISINRLLRLRAKPTIRRWLMDSGAYTTIDKHGGYPRPPEEHAERIWEYRGLGILMAAVSQDYMCEPHMLERTGLTIADHQRLTIERYDRIKAHLHHLESRRLPGTPGAPYLMPVLQGYAPADYVHHIRQYGERLPRGAFVGVGSVCKRNSTPAAVLAVLLAIKAERPDLRLHGFGLKITALEIPEIAELLESSDSMAWSHHARKNGRNANNWREAAAYVQKVERVLAA